MAEKPHREEEMTPQDVEELMEAFYIHEFEEQPHPVAEASPDALRRAEADGLVEIHEGHPRLTDKGREVGRDMARRHRLAELLIRNVLQMPAEDYDAEACRFEHILHDAVTDRVCELLGHPTECPHGSPIPPGECCLRARAGDMREVTPLCDGRPDARGTVAYLATRDESDVRKLMAMGVLPGQKIALLRRFPSYVFQIGFSQFTVDHPLAEVIYVHWSKEAPPPGEAGSVSGEAGGWLGGLRRRFRRRGGKNR